MSRDGRWSTMRWCDKAAVVISDPRFVFMNHGYASDDAEADYSWLQPADRDQKYSYNLVRKLVSGIDLDGKDIVDVGCGRGGSCSYFSRYAEPRTIVGIDRSAGNIEFCRKTHLFDNVEFVQADAVDLPLPSGSADIVFNLESSHLYTNVAHFLKHVYRILKPGGIFCYSDIFDPRPAARSISTPVRTSSSKSMPTLPSRPTRRRCMSSAVSWN